MLSTQSWAKEVDSIIMFLGCGEVVGARDAIISLREDVGRFAKQDERCNQVKNLLVKARKDLNGVPGQLRRRRAGDQLLAAQISLSEIN
ncbi:MAG: hypothetical protein ACWA5R_01045 [bacterium]